MHTSTNEFVRMNSDTFLRMHSYELSNYTHVNANVMTVKDMLCLQLKFLNKTRMWANAQRDGRPAKHRWRLLFNAAKFG